MFGHVTLKKEVSGMISVERNELRAIRMECAVSICKKFPSLYNKIYGKYKRPLSDREFHVADILISLIRLEPSIKGILDYYYRK